MLYSKELQDRLENFTRYARFLSKRFGVRVELDGTSAQTDGKTILLPNIAVLTPRETEFMYGILLHEIGHLKHSTFTEEDFAKLPNQMVAEMANAIEDARVENLLMDEYDGAYDIFQRLYCDYLDDKKLMKKLFNCDLKNSSGFHALGIWMHSRILNIDNLPKLSKMVGHRTNKQVSDFIRANSIELLMEHVVLENWDDVVDIANYVTDLWFKGNVKKQGPTNNIVEQRNVVDELKNVLGNDLQKKVQQVRDDLQRMENEIRAKQAEMAGFRSTPEYIQAQKELTDALIASNQVATQKAQADGADDAARRANKTETANNAMNEKIAKAKERLSQVEAKPAKPTKDTKDLIDNLMAKEAKLVGVDDDKAKKQLKNIQEKLAEARKSLRQNGAQPLKTDIEKAKERLKQLEEEKIELAKKSVDMRKLADDLMADATRTARDMVKATAEERKQKLEEATKTTTDAQNKLNELNKQVEKLQDEINSLVQNMSGKEEKLAKDAKKILANAQNALNKAGVPVNLLPDFMPNPGWETGDDVQKEFDKNAGQQTGEWVANGAGLGTGGRDILLYIEKRAKALDTVDLAKAFKQRNGMSKLDAMNEITTDATYLIDHKAAINADDTQRKHVALTTEFDRVEMKLQGDRNQLMQLQQTHGYFIRPFVQVMRQKLKFARKNHFRGNQEEGDLDARSLWKLASREGEDFFETNNPKFINKISAMIAIDISGSQDKDFTKHGENLQVLTLALSEALKHCHIRHEIIGYHAPVEQAMREAGASGVYNRRSNRLETEVYKTFNSNNNEGITNMELRASDNSDGESLRIAMARLKKATTPRKVLFVLTDGKPFLSDSEVSVLDNDLREALFEAKKNRIEVIAFGFTEQRAVFYDQYCHIQTWQDALQWAKDKMK